jgi:hypothetical protein
LADPGRKRRFEAGWEVVLRNAAMELLDGDAQFGSGQVRAETEVIPGTKSNMAIRMSIEQDSRVFEL